jgi:outer membrane protein assembly factor BamB
VKEERDNRLVSIVRPLVPGDPARLGGYRLLGRLGEGGMGVVHLGRSVGGRLVAVKVIRQRFAEDAEYRARFRREITAAASVTGAFTAAVLDAAPDEDPPWIATAYLPGRTLRTAISDHGPLPPESVRALGAGLAEGLAEIHRAGVLHRDLKPGNVMLTAHGPRLIDFGIAQVTDATAITEAGTLLGTAGYIPPERSGGAPTGPAGDVFALGAVLVFAATGRHPFGTHKAAWAALQRAQRGLADVGDIPDPARRELLRACLRPDPAARPTTADLITHFGAGGPGNAWLPPPIAEAVDRSSREPVGAAVEPVAAQGDPTADPTGGPAPDGVTEVPVVPGRRVPRRAVIGAVGLGAVGVVAAAVGWTISRDARERGRSSPGDRTGHAAVKAHPTPSRSVPKATPLWTVPLGWQLPRVTAAGAFPVAWDWGRLVRVLDPATGATRWQNDLAVTAAGAGDAVYLTDVNSLDVEAHILAINATSGTTLWGWKGPFEEFEGPRPVVVAGGRVVVGNERVRCVDAATGSLLWTAELRLVEGVAAGADLVVVQAMFGNVLCGLDAATGTERWRYTMDGGGPPVLGDGLVFTSEQRSVVHAVRADTGVPVWRQEISWLVEDDLYHGAGLVYANASGGRVVALRAETGEPAWTRQVGTDEGAQYDNFNRMALHGDTLLVSATDRTLYALHRGTGDPLWTFDTQTPAGPAALIKGATGNLVLYPTQDGNVHAVVPPSGGPRAGA